MMFVSVMTGSMILCLCSYCCLVIGQYELWLRKVDKARRQVEECSVSSTVTKPFVQNGLTQVRFVGTCSGSTLSEGTFRFHRGEKGQCLQFSGSGVGIDGPFEVVGGLLSLGGRCCWVEQSLEGRETLITGSFSDATTFSGTSIASNRPQGKDVQLRLVGVPHDIVSFPVASNDSVEAADITHIRIGGGSSSTSECHLASR